MTTMAQHQQKTPVHVEFDDSGLFRIKSFDGVGEWTGYNEIATLKAKDGSILLAVSSYYDGGDLEPEVVYSARAVYGS